MFINVNIPNLLNTNAFFPYFGIGNLLNLLGNFCRYVSLLYSQLRGSLNLSVFPGARGSNIQGGGFFERLNFSGLLKSRALRSTLHAHTDYLQVGDF